MRRAMLEILERFGSLRVAVMGDAILDSFLQGQSEGLASGAPVPLVRIEGRVDVPGGAANTAANVSFLSTPPVFLSVIGTDAEATTLIRVLEGVGVRAEGLVQVTGRQTTVKQRVLAGHRILLRLDSEPTSSLPRETEQELEERLRAVWRDTDAVILSDYGYGLFTDRLLEVLAELQRDLPKVLVVDTKDFARFQRVSPTAVKPNYQEAVRLLGLQACRGAGERVTQISACESEILERSGARIACVTLDVEGSVVFERGRPAYRTFTPPRPDQNANGAGDTFVSALALALAAGADTPLAAELASLAAKVVVEEEGTTCCTLADLMLQLTQDQHKITGVAGLLTQVERLRRQGKRVVFTNGCFDILHRGHVVFLERAKALGDALIVAVNTDESATRLKGFPRPFNSLEDRTQVLAALNCVDYVVGFGGDTCEALIHRVRPDIYVKGGNYTREDLVEAKLVESLGGEVQLLPYLTEFSTSSIVERTLIRKKGG